MKNVLCIGNVSYDVTYQIDGFPMENVKYRVDNKTECGGGPASNSAYLLGKWGVSTYFSGVVGDDDYGNKIIEEFLNVNVNTDYIEKKGSTTLSFVIVNKKNGSRTILTHKDEKFKLENNINIVPDVILVDGQELKTSLEVINNNPNAISILDAGRLKDETIQLGRVVNYLVCSMDFAQDYTNIKVDVNDTKLLVQIYTMLEKAFKNNIVITLEKYGCIYKSKGEIKLMPSIEVTPIDTTGAGDIFHGAFVYCIVNGYDIEKTVKISNIAGALATTKVGGRNSVAELSEVMKIYDEV